MILELRLCLSVLPPGGFLFEGLSDDEDDFHPVSGLTACRLEEVTQGVHPSLGTGVPKLGGGHRPFGGQYMLYYSFLNLAAWAVSPRSVPGVGVGFIWDCHSTTSLILGTSLLQSTRSTPSSSTPSSRPASLGYSGAAGPRPITQSELATALALASTPESSSHTPTPGTQVWREGRKLEARPPRQELPSSRRVSLC